MGGVACVCLAPPPAGVRMEHRTSVISPGTVATTVDGLTEVPLFVYTQLKSLEEYGIGLRLVKVKVRVRVRIGVGFRVRSKVMVRVKCYNL